MTVGRPRGSKFHSLSYRNYTLEVISSTLMGMQFLIASFLLESGPKRNWILRQTCQLCNYNLIKVKYVKKDNCKSSYNVKYAQKDNWHRPSHLNKSLNCNAKSTVCSLFVVQRFVYLFLDGVDKINPLKYKYLSYKHTNTIIYVIYYIIVVMF